MAPDAAIRAPGREHATLGQYLARCGHALRGELQREPLDGHASGHRFINPDDNRRRFRVYDIRRALAFLRVLPQIAVEGHAAGEHLARSDVGSSAALGPALDVGMFHPRMQARDKSQRATLLRLVIVLAR